MRTMARAGLLATGVAAISAWAFDRVEVEGTSMSPTFEPGDRLLLVRRLRAPRPGDLVALRDPRDPARRMLKRVVSVNRAGVEVHGDNPDASTDSRAFGAVPARAVTHVVVRRYAVSEGS